MNRRASIPHQIDIPLSQIPTDENPNPPQSGEIARKNQTDSIPDEENEGEDEKKDKNSKDESSEKGDPKVFLRKDQHHHDELSVTKVQRLFIPLCLTADL